MVHMQALFPKSIDSTILDRFLSDAASIKQAHGFHSLKQSEGDIMSPLGPPPFSKVIEILFDSQEDVMAFAQAHPLEGKDQLKSLGVVMLIYDVSDV
jgi:hypothetical protein